MSPSSALYRGRVAHRRTRPLRHHLAYRVFWVLLDVNEIDAVAARCRMFSHNRFNLFSVFDRDHCSGIDEPLRGQIERRLQEAGIEAGIGRIRLLTMPRILGYAFNPLSIFFCEDEAGRPTAVMYEVNNTFGQRHTYVAAIRQGETGVIRHTSPKRFYVSPFMAPAIDYAFRVVPPADRIAVSIVARDSSGPIITAALTAERTELSDRSLAVAAIGYPLLTIKVIAAIHWEALRMWLKGFRIFGRPPAPERAVTVATYSPNKHHL